MTLVQPPPHLDCRAKIAAVIRLRADLVALIGMGFDGMSGCEASLLECGHRLAAVRETLEHEQGDLLASANPDTYIAADAT